MTVRQYLLDLFGRVDAPEAAPQPDTLPDAQPLDSDDASGVGRPASALARARRRWLADTRGALAERLARHGLRDTDDIRTHANARTMVSWSRRVLRLHGGYAEAPDEVLLAVVRFLDRRTPAADRQRARRTLLGFDAPSRVPAELLAAPRPRRSGVGHGPPRPGDDRLLCLLRERHALLNARHFEGRLSEIPLFVSGRMRRKLGHVALEAGRCTEIVMSRRHVLRDGEAEWMETLLHEMVHQWQAETGRSVDHGPEFRRMARQVGITPRAVRAR